jgi:hypothetical protein
MARPLQGALSQFRPQRHDTNAGHSQWAGPGIFMRVEFGVALTPTRTRQMSFGYASKNLDGSVLRQRQGDSAMARGRGMGANSSQRPVEEDERQQRPRRRQRRSRSALQLRTSPIAPESVLTPGEYPLVDYHPFHPEPVFHPAPVANRDNYFSNAVYSPYRPSPATSPYQPPPHSNSYPPPQIPEASSSRIHPFTTVRQTTIDRRPLPPLPPDASFRLGSNDLPWTSPPLPYADSTEPTFLEPLTYTPPRRQQRQSETSRPENPERETVRTRELGQLHQAMLGIDSIALGNDRWDPGENWDQIGDLGALPRGPRGVGWAIADPTREEERPSGGGQEHWRGRESEQSSLLLTPPPEYTQGQWGWDWEWQESYGYWVRVRGLRRSSSIR